MLLIPAAAAIGAFSRAGLTVWLRADSLSADTTEIPLWSDSSGSGSDARIMPGVSGPTYAQSTAFPSTLPVLIFGGSEPQVLRFTMPAPLEEQELTLVIVSAGFGKGCSHAWSAEADGRNVDPQNADVDALLSCEATADWGGLSVAVSPDRVLTRLGLGGDFGGSNFVNRAQHDEASTGFVLTVVKRGSREETFV